MPETDPQPARAIGEKLRVVRRQQKMSLRELAVKAEISASMLSQIETGKAYPSVRSIYSIAAALAVPVDYFFPVQAGPELVAFGADSSISRDLTASELRDVKANEEMGGVAPEFAARPHAPAPVVRANDRPTIKLKGGITWSRLTAFTEPGAEFLEITYAPGATSGAHMSHHEGREFGLVLEGQLVIELGFELHTLQPGDSIVFDSTTPHRLTNQNTQPLRALWVVWSQT